MDIKFGYTLGGMKLCVYYVMSLLHVQEIDSDICTRMISKYMNR